LTLLGHVTEHRDQNHDKQDKYYGQDKAYDYDEYLDTDRHNHHLFEGHLWHNQYLVQGYIVSHTETHGQKRAYVVIVSYEPADKPFESTDANMLAEFFTDWNNIRTGVRSYVIGLHPGGEIQELVCMRNYVKEVCDVYHVADEQLVNKYGPTPALFFLCHGDKKESSFPACLVFCDETNTGTWHVWARRPESIRATNMGWDYWDNQVYLQDFIGQCGIVFLLCCHGEDIVNDYVSEMTKNDCVSEMPRILFSKDQQVLKTMHPILLALLTTLLDSTEQLERNADGLELLEAMRNSVITILKIVQCCDNDVDEFWNFLLDMGCVATYASEKEQQGLPVTTRIFNAKYHYRVHGHGNHYYIDEEHKLELLRNFRSLCLVEYSKAREKVRYQTCETVKPFPSAAAAAAADAADAAGAGAAAASATAHAPALSKVWHALHNYLSSLTCDGLSPTAAFRGACDVILTTECAWAAHATSSLATTARTTKSMSKTALST
jgi:hypothetical protein